MVKVSICWGINGMDGSTLSDLLLEKGYIVYGVIRRNSSDSYPNIEHIRDKLKLFYGDITDSSSVSNCFNTIYANENKDMEVLEVYNLAAQSHVKTSFEIPVYTGQVDALGTLNILEAIRVSPFKDKIRFYQASTSELYGSNPTREKRNEETLMMPCSPYAVAKLYSYWIVKNYRNSYGLHCSNGILFNHSGPRRTPSFVCRKITIAVAKIVSDKQDCLYLGNLNSMRDIGHSKDYVRGMWMMLQQDKSDDYVLSTEKTYSVRQLVEMAFAVVDKKIEWSGEGLDEVATMDGRVVVKISKDFFRPSEVDFLLGDSTKAREKLGWVPRYNTEQIIEEMVINDLEKVKATKYN